MNKISVILPCYNSSSFIIPAIKSILTQTFSDFEFLIINDGSSDSTEEIILSFSDPRIRYISKQHSGLSDTLNYGLAIAESELVARMDSDDISLPYRLEIEYNYLLNNKKCDVVSAWYAIFENNKIQYLVKTKEKSEEIKKSLLLYSEISHPCCVMKKSVVKNLGGYNPIVGKDIFQDYELWLREKERLNFYNIQRVLLFQRYRKDSLSRKNIIEKYKLHYQIQEPYYSTEKIKLFGLKEEHEEEKYRGWREYFFGEKRKARFFWRKLKSKIFFDDRLIMAYLITFLPNFIFIRFKELRMRFRIEYIFHFFSIQNKTLRKEFSRFI